MLAAFNDFLRQFVNKQRKKRTGEHTSPCFKPRGYKNISVNPPLSPPPPPARTRALTMAHILCSAITILPLRPFLCSTVHSFVLHIVSKALRKSIKVTYSFLCLSSCFWTNANRVKIWSKVLRSCLKPACSTIISLSSIHLVIRLFNTKLYSLLHMLSKDIPL